MNITQVYQGATPTPIPPGELGAAEQRLQALPLDKVPAPAGLPRGSCMPLRRNALFVGREGDLRTLASALKAGGTAAVGQSTAVTGLGGIGKSQLASEFVYCYGQYFSGGVFWLSCADPAALPAEIATSGRNLGLHADFTGLPLDAQINLVASAWHSELPRLLVLDNCEDESDLEKWLPRGGGCRVLVTSLRQDWRPDLAVRVVRLEVLSRGESVALLCKHRPDLAPHNAALDVIAQELGDLPLALHLAGSFLARYRHAPSGEPAAYLEAVRGPDLLKHRSLTIGGSSPTGHEQHVARTFALSYDQLRSSDEVDAMALLALARAAWFAPGEPIPRPLLRKSAEVDGADEAAILRFEDGLARLRELGLISEQENGALVLHRLLGAFARSAAGDTDTHLVQVEAAVFAEAYRLNEAGYPAPLLAWQPELRFVIERAAERESEGAAGLLHELGRHLGMVADFKEAKEAIEQALKIIEQRFGSDHPNTAFCANSLGKALKELGDLAGAREAFERVLKIYEQSLGSDHPSVATSVNNLGTVLHDLGDLAGAKEAHERALKIDEETFGPDHPDVAACVNNLGTVLRDLGDLVGAKEAHERALKIYEQTFGTDHPSVAAHVSNLGIVLQALGDLAGAKAAYERALNIDERNFGPDHPKVALELNNLGGVLQELGDLERAKAAFERALKIDETRFGPDHPVVALRVNNLGGVLHDLGDLMGAKKVHERALKLDEQSFGPDHPRVATHLNNVGSVLHDLGDLVGAKAAFERALKIDEQSLGLDHHHVARDINNLAALLNDLGDKAAAKACLERALLIWERTLGPDHPNARAARHNLESLRGN